MPGRRDSPNRRRSIAVPDQNKPAFLARSKRRAHSIVAGDRLSPLARARRSLGPRKSILKASFTNPIGNASQPNSQSSTQNSSSVNVDDLNATESMDLTTDFQSQQDNTVRRSLSRRVSFAAHCRVRVFQNPNHDNTNSTGSPSSSSPTPPPDTSPSQYEERQVNDENDYPGARSNRRRSSLRYSTGPPEVDMDLTSVGPVIGQADLDGSTIMDEEFEGRSMDDMDGTDLIDNALRRRRSSVATGLSMQPPDDDDVSRMDSEDMERSREDDMEFTIPINRSLRPAQQDDAWLALRRMTHSGSENAQEDMETSEQSISFNSGAREDSFQDNDTSHDLNDGDHTINISKVLGWPSQAEDNSHINTGEESNMEESDVYGPAAPAPGPPPQPLTITKPHLSPAQEEDIPRPEQSLLASRPSVFQPPSADALSRSQTKNNKVTQDVIPLDSRPFTFTAPQPATTRSTSPSKIPVFKPTFTAAFAPPVSKQSPKKRQGEASPSRSTLPSKRPRPDDDEASPSRSTMPSKRPRTDDDDSAGEANTSIDIPSPTKRQAMANRWPRSGSTSTHTQPSPAKASPKPKPLSPSKRTPFQQSSASTSTTRTTSLRRPSGYFARRKSLAVGSSSQPVNRETGLTERGNSQASAGIKSGLGFRRASVGSGSENAWQRFDKDTLPAQGSQSTIQPPNEGGTLGQFASPTRADNPSTTSPPSLSQSPAAPQSKTQTHRDVALTSPARPTEPVVSVDLSNILQSTTEDDAEREPTMMNNADQGDDDTEHWRDILDTGNPEDEETPNITIEQFFAMTGIKFMDELTAPRRSTHPSHLHPSRQAREDNDITLAEYFAAMAIEVPRLELFTRVARDLEAWMEQSRNVYAQAEIEASKMTPELFMEYCLADEEGQTELLHQLNVIRTNVRGQAKSDWYNWKSQWVQSLEETAGEAFNALEEDAKMLEGIKARTDEIIPALEQEYENIMRELEQEKVEVAEIEASDQDYLNELKNTISEQNIEVEALQAELAEEASRLRRLQDRLEASENEKQEASSAIANAQRILVVQKNSTRAEVFKLKSELEALEDLHMFRATRISPELFQYIYNSQFCVSISCHNFVPIVQQVNIARVKDSRIRYRDHFPTLSDFWLEMAGRQIVEGEDLTLKQIVHRLSDYWSSCTQLRSQLRLLMLKYPIDIEIVRPKDGEGLPSFKAHTTVLFPALEAKVIISFIFSTATFCFWPLTLDSLDCEVQVECGPIDRSIILKRVIDRLSQATPAENHACLYDACIEAQETYNK